MHLPCNTEEALACDLLSLRPHHSLQVRKVAEENGVDVSQQILELEARARQVSTHRLKLKP